MRTLVLVAALLEKNREQKRRIEIILVPNLEELPSLTGDQP